MKLHPELIAQDNAMGFMSNDEGEHYNLCHCQCHWPPYMLTGPDGSNNFLVWSNFEIADMSFWRAPAYTTFFEYLDSQGGFYYEVRSSTRNSAFCSFYG
jgi:alpha 1,2-mannosyltransferase